jgi:hypothetical protein
VHKKKKEPSENINFGSFTDIITNVLGILIFLGVMFTLTMHGARFIVRTPKVKETSKKPIFFECRSEQLFYLDKDGIWNVLDRKVAKLLKENPDIVMGEIAAQLYGEKIGNRYYLLDLNKFFKENLLSLVPRAGAKGETIKDLKRPDSSFREVINKLAKDEAFIYFFVKPDSFEIFRIARAYTWEKNIQVGWYPLDYGRSPTFGSRGRRPKMS